MAQNNETDVQPHLIGTDASILAGAGGTLINVLLTPAAQEKEAIQKEAWPLKC